MTADWGEGSGQSTSPYLVPDIPHKAVTKSAAGRIGCACQLQLSLALPIGMPTRC